MNLVKTGRWNFVDITLLYVPPVYYVYYGQLCWIKLSESESESSLLVYNTLRPWQNGCQFPDDIFKCITLKENVCISMTFSLKFPEGRINNILALLQIMAWCRPGNKPLSEPTMISLLTYICITRPQWVNSLSPGRWGHNTKVYFSNSSYELISRALPMKLVFLWML